MLATTLRCAVAMLLIAMLSTGAHAAARATVRGAEAVHVRRGPSTESPAFARLPQGRVVSVESVTGGWALITLPGGQKGYVKAVFLALPAGVVAATAETSARPGAPSAIALAAATPTPEWTPSAVPEAGAESGRHDVMEREIAQLRDRLAAVESAVVATPGGAAISAQRDGAEGAASTRAQERDAGPAAGAAPPVPTVFRQDEPQEISPSLALAGVGLVIGFLLGAAYGQRQERKRHSRVRF